MGDDIMTLSPPSPDARIAYGLDAEQFGELWLPEGYGRYPVVALLHGGYWRARHGLAYMGHIAHALRSEGVVVWNIEYRRLGQAGGGWPGTLLDVARAMDFLRDLARKYPLDVTRVVVAGHSAGGHLAAWVAGRHRLPPGNPLYNENPLPVRGVVSLAGVLDLRLAWERRLSDAVVLDFLGGDPLAYPERYAAASPATLVPLGVPQAIIHGTSDESVPYEVSERYWQAACAAGDDAELITLPGVGHFALVDPRTPEWVCVRAEIMRLLNPAHD